IMHRCVVEAFDLMTRYHKDNTVHLEGWVTNDAYMVKRRVILPNMVRCDGHYRINWSYGTEMDDIDRGLGMLVGKRLSQVFTMREALEASFHEKTGNYCESEFFEIRYYQKGTMHLHFRDKNLWKRFNMAAADGKNWIPGERVRKERAQRKPKDSSPAPEPANPFADRSMQLLLNEAGDSSDLSGPNEGPSVIVATIGGHRFHPTEEPVLEPVKNASSCCDI
nr:DUF4942 domain-containing protein [Bacteroidota bacterium]